jgi:hypothetical protein
MRCDVINKCKNGDGCIHIGTCYYYRQGGLVECAEYREWTALAVDERSDQELIKTLKDRGYRITKVY